MNADESTPQVVVVGPNGLSISGGDSKGDGQEERSVADLVETFATVGSFSLGNIGFSGLMTASAKLLRGVTESSYYEFGEEVYEKQIAALIYPEARALVRAHLDKGHTVAIVSSATPYQVEPAARDLDVEHVMCSRLEVKDGEFTGDIVRPLCWGQGKAGT